MVPELGANRLAFMPKAAIKVEYSKNGGSTWTDYGASDNNNINLFTEVGSAFVIGKCSSSAIATNND
jgi:hypothetical protein